MESVEWTVQDTDALDDKASAAALTKARSLAERMVTSMGAKLGGLLYASNTSRRPKYWPFVGSTEASVASSTMTTGLKLKLFAVEVEREATVHTIFAIE